MKVKNVLMIFIVILIVFLIWGIVGAIAANDPGVTCDMGFNDILCWKWHKNLLGQAGELVNNIFG